MAAVASEGVDGDALGESLQRQGARAFSADWAALCRGHRRQDGRDESRVVDPATMGRAGEVRIRAASKIQTKPSTAPRPKFGGGAAGPRAHNV